MTTEREQWFRDVRELIDFLEEHPELPLPDGAGFVHWDWCADADRVRAIARTLRTFKKTFTDYDVTIKRSFGQCDLTYCFGRTSICEKVQVGTRRELRSKAVTSVEEEVEVPVYEYKCPALMDLDTIQEETE